MPQTKIGRYVIKRELGRGGMATVYLAHDPRFKRDVAVKVLPSQFTHDPTFRARFEREAQTVAALEHPAIVPVYDFGEQNGQPYLVMRYMAGGSLSDKIQRGPLSIKDALSIIIRLAPALDSAHRAGIIHRDLKPVNILFDRWDKPYLSDFGIAKLIEATGTALTPSKSMVGTPAYMSPEQIMSDVKLDGRSDIYSLGIIFFEMLTNRRPYEADTPMRLAYMQVHSPVPVIHNIKPTLPSQFQVIVATSLAKDREERYPTALAMAEAIAAAAEGASGVEIEGPAMQLSPTEVAVPDLASQRDTTQVDIPPDEKQLAPDAQLATPARTTEVIQPRFAEPTKKKRRVWLLSLPLLVGLGALGLLVVAFLVSSLAPRLFPSSSEPESTSTFIAVAGDTETLVTTVTTKAPTEEPTEERTVAEGGVPEDAEDDQTQEPTEETTQEFVEEPVAAISPDNAGEVHQLARLGTGRINDAINSPDGRLLAVASTIGVYLYDVTTLEQVRFLDTDDWMFGLAFSPDGSILASGSSDGTVQLWQVADGALLNTLEAGQVSGNIAFSPDGTTLASGSLDNMVRLWRVADGALVDILEGHTGYINDVAFSPDGTTLISSSFDNTVRLWRVADGVLLDTLEGHTDEVNSVTYSPDGSTLASGSSDATVRLWRVNDGSLLDTLEGHTNAVYCVAISPDGSTLASGSFDNTVRLWRIADGALLETLEGHTDYINSVTFSPDGTTLISGSFDNTVRLWRVADGSLLDTLQGNGIFARAFSPDVTMVSGAPDGQMRLWGMADGALLDILEGSRNYGNIAFSPDGTSLASGLTDGRVRLWRVADGTLIHTLEGHTDIVTCVAFSPDGTTLASGSWDARVLLWRVADGALVDILEGHTDDINDVAFSPDGTTLASGSDDDTMRLWRVADGAPVDILEGHTNRVNSVIFSPDGTTLASGSSDRTVRLWRVTDGTLLHTMEGHTSHVISLAFSPDGTTLASGSTDSTIRLWQVGNGALLATLTRHHGPVTSLAFLPDGTTLASGADDQTVRLWGLGQE